MIARGFIRFGSAAALAGVLFLGPGVDLTHSFLHLSKGSPSDRTQSGGLPLSSTGKILSEQDGGPRIPTCPLCILVSAGRAAVRSAGAVFDPFLGPSTTVAHSASPIPISYAVAPIIARAPPGTF